MKKFKKASALILSGALIAGTFSAMLTANAAKSETIGNGTTLASYENDFNADDLSSALGDDFEIRYDHENWISAIPRKLTVSEADDYADLLDGQIVRINNASESPTDGMRAYWQQLYFYYKNQTFKNFEFSIDLTSTHDGFEMIHFAPAVDGSIYSSGFTLATKYNAFKKQYDLFLGNAAEAATDLDFFYIKQLSTAAHTSITGKEKTVNIKITFNDGTAVAYIDGEKVLEKTGLEQIEYYPAVTLGYNLAADWQGSFDNFKIAETEAASTFERVEQCGIYSNNFNVSGLNSIITKDFNLYYDTSDTTANSLANITTEPSKYMTFANNRLERVHDESELYPWTDGNRPYWCMAYYTYKNQTFKDFTLTVDAYLPTWGSNYNAITVGSMGGGLKSNGGFTLGFYNGAEDALTVYLGNAADVAVNFDDWYVHDCDGKRVYNHGKDQKDYKITLTVFGGMATVKINDVVLFEDFYVGYLDGYISLVNGLVAAGESSYYDNLKIEAITDNGSERNADINLNVIPYSEYTAVSLITDTSLTHINTAMDLSFDNNNFEYAGTVIETDNIHLNSNREIKSDGGNVNLSLLCATNGKIATLYFKNINNTNDFSAFKIKNAKTTLLNGHPVNGEAKLTVKGDYSADKIINIIDLVKGKKLSANNDNSVKSEDLVALRKALLGTCDKIEISPLLGKSALYLGDSIAYGAGDALGLSWAGRIAQRGMVYENVAVSGWALTKTEISGRLQIVTQLDSAKKSDYDFVILEGGVNDVLINERESEHPISFGEITSDGTEFDTATICGAIEDLIVKTKAKFPNAKVGYIINNYFGATEDDMTKYINAVKTACDKHGIDYVDLYNDEYVKANFNNEKHLPDSLHPNAAGYDILSEVIADWMETIAEK